MLVIGLDVGTTGTKAIVCDEKGKILGNGYKEYELICDRAGFVSQKAADWWDAAIYAVRHATENIDRSQIAAISLSTQGASMLAADKDGNALSEVITWMDNRAVAECEELDRTVGSETIYKKCGWRLTPAGDAAKIMWLRANMRDVFDSAACFPSTIEYMNFHLCGRYVTDPTNAAIRQLFNIETGKWDSEILAAVGIGADRLPEVMPIGACVGNLTAEAADAEGLGHRRDDKTAGRQAHEKHEARDVEAPAVEVAHGGLHHAARQLHKPQHQADHHHHGAHADGNIESRTLDGRRRVLTSTPSIAGR